MKTAIQLLSAMCLLLWAPFASAQMSMGAKRGDYTFGINAGYAFQSSDVRSAGNGGGFGLTAGRTLLAGAYSPISVDLRGRLLYARTFGLDPLRSFQIQNNKALNGTQGLNYLSYPANLDEPQGFVFQNYRTTIGEMSAELVFTLEELRRKTGIIASVYGGIGLDGFHSKIDQADAQGNEYFSAYANLNDNRPIAAILRDLKGSVLDGTYETNADGFDDLPKFRAMPSLGVELGFHLTPSLSLHAGHRLTFSGTDLLDGHQWSSSDKDMYHYTNFGITYRFRPPAKPKLLPPVIDITSPSTRTHYTNDPNGLVRARITNVRSAGDVYCRVNGRETPFSFSGEQFTLNFRLQEGRNEVVITAKNTAGSTNADVLIILEGVVLPPPPPPPVGYAPRVSISNPSGGQATVSEAVFAFRATVSDVLSKNDIELTVDGVRRDFTYDSRTGAVSTQLNLREGVNRVRVSARNNFGSDAADAEIRYEPRRFQPVVRITSPENRSETTVNSATVQAEVRYVEARDGISLYVNGRSISTFEFDAARETFRATVPLNEGSNTIELTARNSTGEARDGISVTYRRPVVQSNPPTVRITSPASGSSTTEVTANVEATVREVTRREDVSFFVNGARSDNFTFNAGTGRFSATVNLVVGNNDIAIRVANTDGSDQAAVSIRRTEKPIEAPQPPRVRITTPANQAVVARNTVEVRATIDNITDRNAISLLVNGSRFANFNFSTNTRELIATVTLIEGNNSIRVEATNRDGNANDEVNVRFQKAVPPVVTITAPDDNSTVSNPGATLRARLQNVNDRRQITVSNNGATLSNFNYNTSTGELSAEVTLTEGNNTLRVRAATNDGQDEKSVNVTYRKVAPPTVNITAPDNNSTTTSATTTLRARVQNANNRNQITVSHNGNTLSNYTFNTSTGELSAEVTLTEGNNTLRVRAATNDGQDEKSVNVTYRKVAPPTVNITAPDNNSTTTSATTTLRARVQNANNRNQITVSQNGNALSNYTFNTSTGELSAEVTLIEGNNTLRVRAATNDGQDEKSVNVTYRKVAPPTVNITAPDNNSTTTSATTTLRARVQNANNRNQITVSQNGNALSNYTFNTSTGELSAEVTLIEGNNTLRVRAATNDGQDEKSVNVTYRKVAPPTVRITSPTNNANLETNTVTVKATIENVTAARSVRFTVNGNAQSQFSFENGQFTATVENLREGDNAMVVSASNTDGSAEASVTVKYTPRPADPAPVVKFIVPARSGLPARGVEQQVKASVLHVASRDDILLTRNGKPFGDFNYDAKAKELTATIPLEGGTNTIRVIATNKVGSDTATVTVLRPDVVQQQGPVITIESVSEPTINPMNPAQGRSTVIAKIEGIGSAEQITFTVNGEKVTDFTFNSKSGMFQSTVNLVRGTNTIVIRAENDNGTETKTHTMEF
ncbi:MAG TPA: Ig-like domain-containing protein [Saprospiraceae bacterium]|nr:Ig-like domain-containing protein [Saprospiraceae bacterium]